MQRSRTNALAGVSLAAVLAFGIGGAMAQDATPSDQMAPANDMAPDNTMAADGMSPDGSGAPAVDTDVAESKDSGAVMRATNEMAKVLNKLMELGAKPFHTLTPEQARMQPTPADAVAAVVKDETGSAAKPEAVGKTEDIKIPGAAGDLDARVYWPEGVDLGGEPLPVVMYIHGGGWVVANIDVYDASPRAIANQAKAIVVSVDYRQGPEDKFPAAHEDVNAEYKYIVENAGMWNGNSDELAVVGESAGGNMALTVAIAARDQQLVVPDAIVAVYPVAGKDMNTPSYIENQNAVPLGRADMQWFAEHYLSSMEEAADPRIDLVNADLSNLPPVTIIAAEIDPLRSEGAQLRDRLEAAGVDVTYQLYEGVTHEFFGMAAVLPEARQAQELVGERLMAAFGAAE